MSSSTNRQTPPPITRNSFSTPSNPLLLSKTTRPKSSVGRQRRSKVGTRRLTGSEHQQQRQERQMENIPLDSSTPALQGTVIYIDKSVMNKTNLTVMANALAATVVDKWATSVTHLVHGPIAQHPYQQRQQHSQQQSSSKRHQGQRTPLIISKSLEKKMRVVSPAWLAACYNNKERMPESFYPYDMNSHHRMTSLRHDPSMNSAVDENPFGLEPDEFATIEDLDPHDDGPAANDRRVTDYFQRINDNSRSDDPGIHDDQQDETYHLDFDDTDNISHGVRGNDNNSSSTTNNDDTNGDATGISYSLIEMSQVQLDQRQTDDIPQAAPPPTLRQQHQGDCAYERTSTGTDQVESLKSPVAASVERSIQQMMAMDDGSQPVASTKDTTAKEPSVKLDEEYDDFVGDVDLEDDNATSLTALPDMDPNRQPKVTLGREDRLEIWYGEQSFCLDAGMPLSKKRNDYVDLTSSNSPHQENNENRSSASSALRLSTSKLPTTTKRFKKSC